MDTLASVIVDEHGRSATFSGEIDLASYEELMAAVSTLMGLPGNLECDMADVSFIDSSGIRLFVRLERAIRDRGLLHLRGPSPHIARVFQVAGLPDLGIVIEEERDG